MKQYLLLSGVPFMLAACSLLSPVNVEPPQKYFIDAIPSALPTQRAQKGALFVLAPETRPIYNTTQMAYKMQPHQIAFFGYNEWGESPSQMLHPLLIKTLQNTNAFKAVVAPPYNGPFAYALTTQILELVQDFTQCPAVLRFSLRVQLLDGITREVLNTHDFSFEEPILGETPYRGVIAANHATANLLQRLTNFILKSL